MGSPLRGCPREEPAVTPTARPFSAVLLSGSLRLPFSTLLTTTPPATLGCDLPSPALGHQTPRKRNPSPCTLSLQAHKSAASLICLRDFLSVQSEAAAGVPSGLATQGHRCHHGPHSPLCHRWALWQDHSRSLNHRAQPPLTYRGQAGLQLQVPPALSPPGAHLLPPFGVTLL